MQQKDALWWKLCEHVYTRTSKTQSFFANFTEEPIVGVCGKVVLCMWIRLITVDTCCEALWSCAQCTSAKCVRRKQTNVAFASIHWYKCGVVDE